MKLKLLIWYQRLGHPYKEAQGLLTGENNESFKFDDSLQNQEQKPVLLTPDSTSLPDRQNKYFQGTEGTRKASYVEQSGRSGRLSQQTPGQKGYQNQGQGFQSRDSQENIHQVWEPQEDSQHHQHKLLAHIQQERPLCHKGRDWQSCSNEQGHRQAKTRQSHGEGQSHWAEEKQGHQSWDRHSHEGQEGPCGTQDRQTPEDEQNHQRQDRQTHEDEQNHQRQDRQTHEDEQNRQRRDRQTYEDEQNHQRRDRQTHEDEQNCQRRDRQTHEDGQNSQRRDGQTHEEDQNHKQQHNRQNYEEKERYQGSQNQKSQVTQRSCPNREKFHMNEDDQSQGSPVFVKMAQLLSSILSVIEVFHKYAKENGDCALLCKEELKQLLLAEFGDILQRPNDPETVETILNLLDQDRDGHVDFHEYLLLVFQLVQACYRKLDNKSYGGRTSQQEREQEGAQDRRTVEHFYLKFRNRKDILKIYITSKDRNRRFGELWILWIKHQEFQAS
ncbi:PREDICTED: repetin [Mandrillus leucophaeus]|uniref:repetin n=1 Tax=Mandrillus leucophaeus TaxID=9568 RepID=UPI0005F42924|nr:PREDICTED: repetin [Mandrillus leucophaeus]